MKLVFAVAMPLLAVACAPLPPVDTSAGLVGVTNEASELQDRRAEQEDEDGRSETDHDRKEELHARLVRTLFCTLTELAADTIRELCHC